MNRPGVGNELRWRRARSVEVAALLAPRVAGVYAYAECELVHGLPSAMEWIYVGKARRLDQRLSQHDAGRERHAQLRDWLHQHRGSGEVWYAAVDPGELDIVERSLIRALAPRLNRIRYASRPSSKPPAA